jgi:hypothetical protein
MGVMDIFKKSEEKASFDSFPDISNYRTYIFMKGDVAGASLQMFREKR